MGETKHFMGKFIF